MATRAGTAGRLTPVVCRLLLDEMFPEAMGEQLRAKGHDVRGGGDDPRVRGLPDEEILSAPPRRAGRWSRPTSRTSCRSTPATAATSRSHAGLVMVSTKTFPQNRAYVAAVTSALDDLLASAADALEGRVVFLQRE